MPGAHLVTLALPVPVCCSAAVSVNEVEALYELFRQIRTVSPEYPSGAIHKVIAACLCFLGLSRVFGVSFGTSLDQAGQDWIGLSQLVLCGVSFLVSAVQADFQKALFKDRTKSSLMSDRVRFLAPCE